VNLSRKSIVATVGTVCLFVGISLFPFGSDIVYSFLTYLGGGNTTMGFYYAYLISYTLILIGIFIVKPGVVKIFGNPVFFIVLSILGYGVIYWVFMSMIGGMG
jgi:hypothetical protein